MKSKSKIIGYVVVSGDKSVPGVYSAGQYGTEEGKILWFGNGATLFPTRAIAKKFIERSKKYAETNGYSWDWLENSYPVQVRNLG